MKAVASVRVAMKFLPTVGKKLSEGFIAHHNMGNRAAFCFPITGLSSNPDQVNEAFLENHFKPSNKKCRLHALPSLKNPGQLDHGVSIPETIVCGQRTAIGRDGFRKLSVATARPAPTLGKKPAKRLFEHGHPSLDAGLGGTVSHLRQVGPEDQPHKNLFSGLDLESGHKEAGERFGLREVRQIAVSVGRHFRCSRLNSCSRVLTLARDCRRHPAGLVALSVPFGMGHRSFVSVLAFLSPLVSVAGNGDSNDRFWKLGTAFRALGNPFRDPAAWRWSHV
jgi:hypothetical protein